MKTAIRVRNLASEFESLIPIARVERVNKGTLLLC